MKTIERISSTLIRHNWKSVAEGVAAGKTFIVENHGVPEAVVSAPGDMNDEPFDVEAHFARVMARKPVPLAKVEITRETEM